MVMAVLYWVSRLLASPERTWAVTHIFPHCRWQNTAGVSIIDMKRKGSLRMDQPTGQARFHFSWTRRGELEQQRRALIEPFLRKLALVAFSRPGWWTPSWAGEAG